MTPQRTNSPIRGNTKLDILPILIPLKVVVRVMLSSIGSRSLLQRKALSQKANAPAAIERRIYSHLQLKTPSMKSFHSTSRKDTHNSMAARQMETTYFSTLLIFTTSDSLNKHEGNAKHSQSIVHILILKE